LFGVFDQKDVAVTNSPPPVQTTVTLFLPVEKTPQKKKKKLPRVWGKKKIQRMAPPEVFPPVSPRPKSSFLGCFLKETTGAKSQKGGGWGGARHGKKKKK